MDGEKVGSLYYDLTIDDSKLKAGLADSQKQVGDYADKTVTAGDSIKKAMNVSAVALAGVAVGLTAYAKNATDYTENLVKENKALGTQLGISTTEASRLSAAFQRMGVDSATAKTSLGIFEKQISAATNSTVDQQIATQKLQIQMEATKKDITDTTKEIADHGDKTGALTLKIKALNNTLADQQNQLDKSSNAFQQLGISTIAADGTAKDFNTLLFEVADKFKNMPNGIEKTTLSMQLFGRSGKDMIKVLNLGSDGIQDLEKKADALGLTLNAHTISAVNGLVQSQKNLKDSQDAMKIAVGTTTAPLLTKYNEKINQVTQSLINTKGPVHEATVGILAFGGPIAGAASATIGFIANLDQAGPALAEVGKGFAAVFTNPYVLVIIAIAGAVALMVAHLGGLKQVLQDLSPILGYFNSLWQLMQQMFQQIQPTIQYMITLIGDAFGAAFQRLWDSVVRLWNALQPALLDALKILGGLIGGALVVAIGIITGALLVLADVFRVVAAVITDVINWISNFIGWIGNAVGVVINAVKTIVNSWSYIKQAFVDTVKAIPGALGSLASSLYQSGVDLIEGMTRGITDAFKRLTQKLKDAVGSAVSTVKGWLGIHSPSTVFHDIGTNVGQGFINGVDSMNDKIMGAAQNMANAVVDPSVNILQNPATFNGATGAQQMGANQNVYHIAAVNLTTPEATREFFNIGNRNVQLAGAGGSPLAGTTGV